MEGRGRNHICNPGQTGLFFSSALGPNGLRVGGTVHASSTPDSINVDNVYSTSYSPAGGPPLHFNFLASNTNITPATSLQVEIHMTYGNPSACGGALSQPSNWCSARRLV